MTVQPRYLIGAAIGVPILALLMFRGPLTAAAPGNSLNASNSMFGCEESQQLVVKQVAVGNELQLAMKCVDTAARTAAFVDESAVPQRVPRVAADLHGPHRERGAGGAENGYSSG